MLAIIRDEIEKRGIKHRWLAGQIGVHPTTLSRFLTGKTVLSNAALKSLLRELSLSNLFPVNAGKDKAS